MSSRKLDNVYSLDAMMANQSQQSSTLPRNKSTRSNQATAAAAKVDFHAVDSDSDEESVNSDSSDDEKLSVPSFLQKSNGPVTTSNVSSPMNKAKRGKEDEVADSDSERKATAVKPTEVKKKAPVRPESSSEESSSESEAEEESESESDSESPEKATPATEKAAPKAASSTSSESESESESEAEETVKPAVNGKAAKAAKAASTSSSEASSGESSSDEEESSEKESSSDEESDKEAADESISIVDRRNSKELNVPSYVGKDFVLRQAQGHEDGKDMVEFFAKAKLDGKQLWYFTAPASIPINVIEKLEIPMDKAQNGEAIFKHNSEDYTVGFNGEASTSIQLLIPNKKGTRYDSASQKVDNILHVKRVTQLPGAAGVNGSISKQQDYERPQPPGLRVRYRPIGVSENTPMGKIGIDASSDSEEDVEMTAAPAPSSSNKKSKSAAADIMDIDKSTPKSKKEKKSKAAKASVQDSQSSMVEVPDSQPLLSEEKKRKKRRDSIESISSVGSSPKPGLVNGQKAAVATPDPSKKASKRKHPEDEDTTSAQLQKETLSAEKKAKKVKRDGDSSVKKETKILPPLPKAGYSFSSLPASSSPAPTSTPLPTIMKKTKETPIPPPSVRRESTVPVPQVPQVVQKRTSPATTAAAETPKDKRKRKESKTSKKETPVPQLKA